MADDTIAKDPAAPADVPEGFTLVHPDPGAGTPATGGSPVPKGLTEVTPANPPGAGVLMNPGGDAPGTNTNATVPTQSDADLEPKQKSVTDFLLNQAPHSLFGMLQNIGSAVVHPINTGNVMGNLIAGSFKAAARGAGLEMPENESDQVARAFWSDLKNRYGGSQEIQNSLYHDPAGVLADFSTLVSAAGGVAKLASLGAKVGALSNVSEALGTTHRACS